MTPLSTLSLNGRRLNGGGAARYVLAFWTAMVRVAIWLEAGLEKSRSRRALQELSDHQLKDIGLSRADAFRECNRPFWD